MRATLAFVIALAGAGCVQVFDIDQTAPAIADVDGDGIADEDDNCVTTPNTEQDDSDGDQRGNACDVCPQLAGSDQHDEDHDGIGDACDVCPAHPDFGDDTDGDGVGDQCDRDGLLSERKLFAAFAALGPELVAGDVAWTIDNDEAAPVAALPGTDRGLRAEGVVVTGGSWFIQAQTRTLQRWGSDERFQLALDSVGTAAAPVACTLSCIDSENCQGVLSLSTGQSTMQLFPAAVVANLQITVLATAASATQTTYACVWFPLPTLKLVVANTSLLAGIPSVHASPNIHVANLEVVQ